MDAQETAASTGIDNSNDADARPRLLQPHSISPPPRCHHSGLWRTGFVESARDRDPVRVEVVYSLSRVRPAQPSGPRRPAGPVLSTITGRPTAGFLGLSLLRALRPMHQRRSLVVVPRDTRISSGTSGGHGQRWAPRLRMGSYACFSPRCRFTWPGRAVGPGAARPRASRCHQCARAQARPPGPAGPLLSS